MFSGIVANPPDRSKDPLVGHWRLAKHEHITEIADDGSARNGHMTGVWKLVPTENVQRKYEIKWNGGSIVDTVTLSEDGSKFFFVNSRGEQFNAVKIVD